MKTGNTEHEGELTAAGLSAMARRLYTRGPGLLRRLQHFRPYICPFEALVSLVPRGSRVLDVGCGGGLFLGLLWATGRLEGEGSGVGFDSSRVAIELARENLVAGAGAVAGVAGCAGALRFELLPVQAEWPAGLFDVVSIIDVLHHVPPASQRSVIELAAERVAPGGVLLYKDMCRRPVWRAWANRLHDLVLARQWIHYAPVENVETWAAAKGLRLEVSRRLDRWVYGHELRVFRRGE